MTRREKHNIKSNCVTFEDDCYNETSDYYKNIEAMDRKELDVIQSVVKTGESFVRDIAAKIKQAIGA